MTFGSLFAGVGGFDLGFERAGMTCQWQVELDPFCRAVLAKHWPHVNRYEDVRDVGAHNLERVDVICGGFPCQDVSDAGPRVGIMGARSGLWREMERVIRELRPRYVVVENVASLLFRGIDIVIGDLAALGYDTEWDVLSACAFGAPHTRERVFIVAYAKGERQLQCWRVESGSRCQATRDISYWSREPMPSRVADGISGRMDRLRGLGNAVVPQITQWIGERLMEVHQLRRRDA